MRTTRTIAGAALVLAAASVASAGWFDRGPSPTSGGIEKGNFTILLFICRGSGGLTPVQQARLYKEHTEKDAGWKYLFIVNKDDYSALYWGKYNTVKDAEPNLKKAQEYLTPRKIKVFAQAMIIPLPGKDVGPPEWNLDNTDPNYVHTVLIAEFHDVPSDDPKKNYVGRREFAVMYCKQLRGEGEPAFYRHSKSGDSIVTVGLFKKDAIANVKKKDGTVERKIVNPAINAILKKHPKLAVNGRELLYPGVDPKTGRFLVDSKTMKKIMVPAPTYVIDIPREKPKDEPTTKPASKNRAGDEKPGKTQGNEPGARRPAGSTAGTGGTRRD